MAFIKRWIPPLCHCGQPATHEVGAAGLQEPVFLRCKPCAVALYRLIADTERDWNMRMAVLQERAVYARQGD